MAANEYVHAQFLFKEGRKREVTSKDGIYAELIHELFRIIFHITANRKLV